MEPTFEKSWFFRRLRLLSATAVCALALAACGPSGDEGASAPSDEPAAEEPAAQEPAAQDASAPDQAASEPAEPSEPAQPEAPATPAMGADTPAASQAGDIDDRAEDKDGSVFDGVVFPHDVSDIPHDEGVTYGVLENGMRYAIMENDTPTNTASVYMHVNVGSFMEAEDQLGMAHFLEHMAFNGSENVPEGEMPKILERYGLAFGPDTNAGTNFNLTVYLLNLPSAEEEVVDTALFLMRETAGKLTLAPDAIDRERGVILGEERVRNTPGLRRSMAFLDFLFPEAIIPDRFAIGTIESIKTMTPERFRDFYDGYYNPERTFMVVVGDVDKAQIEAKIKEVFADFERRADPLPDPDLGTLTQRGFEAGYFQDPDSPTFVQLFSVKPAEPLADTREARFKSGLRELANAVVSRRIQSLASKPDAVFLQGGVSSPTYFDFARVGTMTIVAEPDQWQAAMGIAEQELRRAVRFGFTQAEIDEQLANYRTQLETAVKAANTRETRDLASGIYSSFEGGSVFTHPRTDLEIFEAYEDRLTPEAVWDAFKEQWEGVEPLAFLSTSLEIEDPEAQIAAAYSASKAVEVTAPEDTGALTFAYTDFGTAGAAEQGESIEDVDAATYRFGNNVKLTLKKTDFEENIIRVRVRVGGGLLEMPKDKPGVNFLLANGFADMGLEAHSADELERIMAGKNVSTGVVAGGDAFTFSSATTAEDFETQLQLWTAYLTAPGYREEGLAQFRKLMNIFLDTLDASPGNVAGTKVPSLIRSGDPRYGFPEKSEMLARDIDDLKAFISRAWEEGHIEIGVVGDFDEQAVLEAVARTFGALPERAGTPNVFADAREVTFPEPDGIVTLTHEGEPNRAVAQVYWPTTDGFDARQSRVQSVLVALLRLRLTDKVREELGATYSAGVGDNTSTISPGYGYMNASLDIEPERVDELFDVVDTIAADLQAGNITEDEFERAKRPLLEDAKQALENNAYWLNFVEDLQTKSDNLARHSSLLSDYESITIDEVKAYAARYMLAETAFKVQVLPSEAAKAKAKE